MAGVSHFFRVLVQWRMSFRNQDLGGRYAHCIRPRHRKYTLLSTYLPTYWAMCSYWYLQFSFNTTGFVLASPLSISTIAFVDTEKRCYQYLQCIYFHPLICNQILSCNEENLTPDVPIHYVPTSIPLPIFEPKPSLQRRGKGNGEGKKVG